MRVLFFHLNGIDGNAGGVSRITETLGKVFNYHGVEVWYVGARNIDKGKNYNRNQSFVPDPERINSENNLDYLRSLIKANGISCIINQAALNRDAVDFLGVIKRDTGVKVISCLHNSVLTPVLNGAYQKEFLLRKKHLSIVFYILRNSIIKRLLVTAYINKYRPFYLNIVRKSDIVVLLCAGQVDELRKICGDVALDKIKVIPNCFFPSETIVEYKKKKNIVLWVGTFDYAIKRPDNMLRIWRKIFDKHRDWELYMLGDGKSLTQCKELAKKRSIERVHFPGRVNPDNYYKEAKVLCSTSVHECFPMVFLEGMNNKTAIVSFNSFTSAKMLVSEADNGILVPAFDIDAYANSLDSLLEDERVLAEYGENASKAISRFSPEIVYNKWLEIL